MFDFGQMNIIVVGAGQTGLALADYLLGKGAEVTLSDRRSAEQLPELGSLIERGLHLDLDGHDPEKFAAADLIVISPGVPLTIPALRAARQAQVPILGEVEIAARDLSAPLIGITGTNGKSTTTALLGAMLQAWGKRVFVGGNLGTPLITAVAQDWDWLVVELSSFQLEAVERFRPKLGLLLNFSEDHLDRYLNYTDYRQAKLNLFARQQPGDLSLLNADDPLVAEAGESLPGEVIWFSASQRLESGICRDGDWLVWRYKGSLERFPVADLRLRGAHNLENLLAALGAALLVGCPATVAWEAACAFTGLPHRMQSVATVAGVDWINDSKGTNVGSVVKSLAGLTGPVTLIAGGRDKGGDYAPLAAACAGKVSHLLLIGEAAERMADALHRCGAEVQLQRSLEDAVAQASALTRVGGTVLLSPACSSFDMFQSYAARGDRFAELVEQLLGETEADA